MCAARSELLVADARQTETACGSPILGKWTLRPSHPIVTTKIRAVAQDEGGSIAARRQQPDGYIGNYAPELATAGTYGAASTPCSGLLAYYDLTGDKKALEGAVRLADHLLTQIPAVRQIERTGIYRGMSSCSILEPIMLLYNRTLDERYLDFVRYIVDRMESADGPQLIAKALDGVPVSERFPLADPQGWFVWENGQKAYEMMSCYDGLLELYKVTNEPRYLEAVEATVANIIADEINIAGSGSSFECFYKGRPSRRSRPTIRWACVTMTWMKLCYDLLRLTRNPLYADQIERSTYNALVASMKEDASQIAKYSPLEGARSAGEEQCGMHVNCCNMNGPRAFALLPEVAVTDHGDELFVNLYGPMSSAVGLDGGEVLLEQATSYPEQGDIEIRIDPRKSFEFTVSLRIPAWSAVSMVTVNGQSVDGVTPGEYLRLKRRWEPGDRIGVKLDMRGRLIRQGGFQAIERGPVVLARDTRFGDNFVDEAVVVQATDGFVTLLPVEEKPEKMWMAFSAPMILGTDLGASWPRHARSCCAISLRQAILGTGISVTGYGSAGRLT
ncbi:MAG: beta-L-arabinofuranosidase domain-containing protein [Alistipes sp.]